jgi:CpeT protein
MTRSAFDSALPASDFITLAHWMAGDFSNAKQAMANPTQYAHIHVLFRPLPVDFFGGLGFYSEQVYDYDLWTPYRQGVHRLVDQGDRIYIENYGLQDAIRFAGASRELSILKTITHDQIARRYNCSMVFQREGDRFLGSVEGNQCFIEKQGCQTYLISEVEITETTWNSLDKGMDINTHEQLWGSQSGPLCFEKRQSFADEIPPMGGF